MLMMTLIKMMIMEMWNVGVNGDDDDCDYDDVTLIIQVKICSRNLVYLDQIITEGQILLPLICIIASFSSAELFNLMFP